MANEPGTMSLGELDKQIAQASIESSAPTQRAAVWTAENAMTVSASILLFGAFTIVIAALLIKWGHNSESTLRVLGTITIIFASIFLIVAGYSDKQIAPVMGLLGTIAGYLLGKSSKDG